MAIYVHWKFAEVHNLIDHVVRCPNTNHHLWLSHICSSPCEGTESSTDYIVLRMVWYAI